jgi:hypothetical protein
MALSFRNWRCQVNNRRPQDLRKQFDLEEARRKIMHLFGLTDCIHGQIQLLPWSNQLHLWSDQLDPRWKTNPVQRRTKMQIARARFWEEAGVMDKREKEREIKRGATCGGVAWGGRKCAIGPPGRRRCMRTRGAVGAVVLSLGRGSGLTKGDVRKVPKQNKQRIRTNEPRHADWCSRSGSTSQDNKKEGEVSAKQRVTREGTQPQAQALTVTGDEISMTSISYDLAVGVLGF